MAPRAQYLNFGAGDPASGWINLDASPHFMLPAQLHRVLARLGLSARSQRYRGADYRFHRYRPGRALPFADASLRAVYSSHVLEHLPAEVIEPLLAEFWRVLVPGGVARIVVPDLARMADRAFARSALTIPLDRELGTLPAEVAGSRVRAALEGLMGFPSLHRTALSERALVSSLGGSWGVRSGLGYLESALPRELLGRVEEPERCVDALVVELTRPTVRALTTVLGGAQPSPYATARRASGGSTMPA